LNPKNSSKNSSNRNTSRERSDHTIALQLLHKITRSVFATRLSFAFALIAAMTAIMVGVITYVTWSIAFEDYVRENVQEATDLTADDAEYFASQTEFLTEHDREMRSTTLLAISVAGLVAVSISVIIGGWYSDLLAAPIVQVTRAVRRMRDGDDDARVDLAGNDEIAQLGSTFNHMADTLAQRRRRERYMIDDLAHELRTPLMGIQATLEAIQDGVYPADSEHLQIVSDETMRLTGLTNALLELSMLEKYAEDFPLSRIDLNDPVRTSVAVSQARAQSLGLHIEMDLTDGLRVNADAARLQQAITNLLSNAIRYSQTGQVVVLRSFRQGDDAYLTIADTGIGIDAVDLEHIFSRFWRADDARGRSSGGVGIGLAITKEIVDRHQGKISIESEKDVGTTCTIVLPLV